MRIFNNQPLALFYALTEEKGKNKFIGRFGTTGHIHEGHLINIRRMRTRCDILVISFVYYFPALFGAISQGTYISQYYDLMERDLGLLKNLDFEIDYVSFDYLDRQLFIAGMENKIIIENDSIFEKLGNQIKNSDYVKTYVASLMTRPRHELLADISWISEKDGLPLITTIWLNQGINYSICPAVRRSDGALYDSKDQMLTDDLKNEKWKLGLVSQKYQSMLYEGKNKSEIEEEAKFILGDKIEFKGSVLIDLDHLEKTDSIKKNIYFEFVAKMGDLRFTDAKIMVEDKTIWLPVDTF